MKLYFLSFFSVLASTCLNDWKTILMDLDLLSPREMPFGIASYLNKSNVQVSKRSRKQRGFQKGCDQTQPDFAKAYFLWKRKKPNWANFQWDSSLCSLKIQSKANNEFDLFLSWILWVGFFYKFYFYTEVNKMIRDFSLTCYTDTDENKTTFQILTRTKLPFHLPKELYQFTLIR